ncbi:hypothetical protein GPECTOR_13g839 [Gonium pectorale]|uniref:DUF488 domain-containing protein n=1 Tax=Gonium pectorale TaxID=33097 RepID=A0A150GNH9_GONPE|nr:hypothetical protein GPECTOR_13g839 [Gonium pectorale]|eukprot:KXZ51351.1 hypothetical protein GPECTOR_13g839 [Gonium pectorale]
MSTRSGKTREKQPPTVYTVGHSTHELAQLLGMLRAHKVQRLVDIRTVPRSRTNPQFNKDVLPAALEAANIQYTHLEALGGLRRRNKEMADNDGWENASFRGFADYMQTEAFAGGLDQLVALARSETCCLMCAETLYWRCHRRMVADALVLLRGWRVLHIDGAGKVNSHRVTEFARVRGVRGGLCYPECSGGYDGRGPLCVQPCPERFKDLQAACGKPDVYGRGVGYPLWQADRCRADHPQGCDRWGLLYYPRCRDGFGAWGCCLCTPPCPDGMKELGPVCGRDTYGRGVGKVPGCEADKEQDATQLCYDKCSPAFSGFGPLCWASSCPPHFPATCGPICAANREACGRIGRALGTQIASLALSSSAFLACATSTFDSFGAAAACWGMAIAKAGNSGAAAEAFWEDNFIMCAADGGDDGAGSGGTGGAI